MVNLAKLAKSLSENPQLNKEYVIKQCENAERNAHQNVEEFYQSGYGDIGDKNKISSKPTSSVSLIITYYNCLYRSLIRLSLFYRMTKN